MRLVFVYNAEAGLIAGALDTIHKTLSPDTYPCSLCALTHGPFAMDRRWRAWLKALPVKAVFHHRRDFHAAWPDHVETPLPLIAIEQGGALEIVVDAEELNQAASLDALMAVIEARAA